MAGLSIRAPGLPGCTFVVGMRFDYKMFMPACVWRITRQTYVAYRNTAPASESAGEYQDEGNKSMENCVQLLKLRHTREITQHFSN